MVSGLRCLFAATLALTVLGAAAGSVASDEIQFNRDIRPILLDTCFACHGPDSASRKADLRLDQRDAAISAGAISPGKPDESEFIRRILTDDPAEVMPPPALKKTLTAEQKKILVEWIKSGAEYQKHWSYIAPARPPIPAVKVPASHSGWVRNPIDSLVLAKLAEHKLLPNQEADRHVLARRAALDITGLPPKPEMLHAFLNDKSADAYEKYVDKLLALPEWGEHRGRYWLDYARYADTHGIHFDNYREMWAYRDWVIQAFNRNMPYDQFTIENLAGDLLPNATLDQKIASGFNRCNMTTNEGGIIDEEYAVLYTRDRTETVSTVWMGLTANCATCHSHKFDQLSQKEFYQMAAFFNNTTQPVRDGNIKDTPPIIQVPQEADRKRFEELPSLISDARASVESRRSEARGEFNTWVSTATPATLGTPVSDEGLQLKAELKEGEGRRVKVCFGSECRDVELAESTSWQDTSAGKSLTLQGTAFAAENVGDFESDQPFTVAAWIRIPANDGTGSLFARMDAPPVYRGWDFWIQQRRIGMHLVHNWPEKALKVVSRDQIPANEWTHVAITYDGSRNASGLQIFINGNRVEKNIENDRLDASSIRTSVPWKLGSRSATDPFNGAVSDVRIQQRLLSAAEVDALAKLSRFEATLVKAADKRTEAEVNELYSFWLNRFDASFQQRSGSLAALEKEQADIRARGTIAHVMNEKTEAAMAFILARGEYDKRGEPVNAETPSMLPPFPTDAPKNRLGFAKWLLRPDHPLTARVTVNRYWQEVFGTGIVRTTGDLGISGELPSNQELLDWLAVDFRESGWDVKRLIRMMVTSAAYRQSAAVTPEKLEKDPTNRLLSRGPRFRMDAEMVRDYALSTSGLLVERIGGPSVKPYQPEGVWEAIAMNVSNTRSYQADSGDNLYRRSLYTFVKRMAPPASMDIFNAPNRELCVVRRERTNTPLQALVTLNDEQFVEAARVLAATALVSEKSSDEARMQWIAERVLCRPLRHDEMRIVTGSLKKLSEYYTTNEAEAKKLVAIGESKRGAELAPGVLASWTMLCNELMNLDEVLNK